MRIVATLFPPVLSIAACVPISNPSFPVTRAEAATLLKKEAATPQKLERPLVILGGFLDVGVGPAFYARKLQPYVRGESIRISFMDCMTFEACRRRVVATLDRALGNVSPAETVEVDVIGQSMGGLVAMHAALADPALGKRLKIRRLFTISSPLQGASRAARMPLDVLPLTRDMRPGSALYAKLAKQPADYEIFSYTRLDDRVVGERYASLPGRGVWWVDTPPFESAHAGAFGDSRVMLDIVRRLRGGTPLTLDPPAPLPATRPAASPRRE
jgi:pimeloyl-ACP methyl ester carboxylesterase